MNCNELYESQSTVLPDDRKDFLPIADRVRDALLHAQCTIYLGSRYGMGPQASFV